MLCSRNPITYVHKSGAIKKESAIPLSFGYRRVNPTMLHIHQRRTMSERLTSAMLVLLKHDDTYDTAWKKQAVADEEKPDYN